MSPQTAATTFAFSSVFVLLWFWGAPNQSKRKRSVAKPVGSMLLNSRSWIRIRLSVPVVFPKHVRHLHRNLEMWKDLPTNFCRRQLYFFKYLKYIRAGAGAGADQNWLRLYCIAYRLIIFYSFWLKGDIKMQVIYSIVTGGLLVNLCTIICFKIGWFVYCTLGFDRAFGEAFWFGFSSFGLWWGLVWFVLI